MRGKLRVIVGDEQTVLSPETRCTSTRARPTAMPNTAVRLVLPSSSSRPSYFDTHPGWSSLLELWLGADQGGWREPTAAFRDLCSKYVPVRSSGLRPIRPSRPETVNLKSSRSALPEPRSGGTSKAQFEHHIFRHNSSSELSENESRIRSA